MKDAYHEKTKKSNEEVKAIKEDIQDIVKRLGNLKGEALEMLSQESEELISNVSNIKDYLASGNANNFKNMCACIERNPVKTVLSCVGAGIILCMLMKK